MKCPNCNKEMLDKSYKISVPYFWDNWDEDEYILHDKYYCKECKITYENNKWKVPKALQPTDKQINTILFINNRLRSNFEAITKCQCWAIINQYFEKAKNTHWYDNITDEDCDMLGLDASMFY